MLSNHARPSVFVRNAFAVAAFVGATVVGASAQQAAPAGGNDSSLFAVNTRPMDLAQFAGVDYSSSTSSVDTTNSALPADPGSLKLAATGEGMQPPPRRRYGSPRYNDKSHNADGSNKYTFVGAVGFELPTGNTYHYFNTNYAFQVGGGRQFNKKFAVLAQFDYDHFGINGATLQNQLALYQTLCPSSDPNCLTPSTLDGSNHVWSFTVNPVYNFYSGDKYGAYVVAGVGFYHKVTTFTTPQEGTYCDPYYGICENYVANAEYDHYTSNAPGFNAGFGLTYKFSRFADERFFIEGRYVFVDNSQRTGYTNANYATTSYSGSDAFPANSNRTTYIPIKVGIRF